MKERCADVLTYLMNKKSNDAFPVLSTLSCDGKLIAVHFGICASGVLHRWFPAYDPEFSTYSPGKILYKQMLVAAHELGIACIDRGDGDSMAKRDFATEEHFYYKGLVHVGIKGALAALATKILWRLKLK